MNIRTRIARLEDRIGRGDKPCPNHLTTCIMTVGDPEPEESEIPPCPNCARPGVILEIVHEIVVAPKGVDGQ